MEKEDSKREVTKKKKTNIGTKNKSDNKSDTKKKNAAQTQTFNKISDLSKRGKSKSKNHNVLQNEKENLKDETAKMAKENTRNKFSNIFKKINSKKKVEKQRAKFNLLEVIIIMIITAVCAITITIKVSYAINKTPKKIMTEAELVELVETYESIVDDYYEDVDKNELIDAAISGMIEYLDDPYSTYLDEYKSASFNEELEGEYVGMGGEITFSKEGKIYITKIFENSPAASAGLKVKDIITKIDGKSVEGMNLNEVSDLIKGKSGTKVELTILREGKEETIEVTRGKVDIESVTSKIISKGDKKIGVINISVFANNTYDQFVKVEKELEESGIDSLILDLRGNSGGYLTTVKSIAELFLNKNDIIYQLDTKGKIEKVINKKDPTIKLKTAVLVNKASASASEILTAALKENLSSPVIGVTTYGKGKVQKTRTLSSGAMIKYTIQNWLTPEGNEIEGKGVAPTDEVELDEKYYVNPTDENDNQLQKALEIMSR